MDPSQFFNNYQIIRNKYFNFTYANGQNLEKTIVEDELFHLEYAGGVKIGDRSRILTGAVIQKPYQAFYTIIGNDTVVSTKVIIGHGSKVGNRTLLSGNSSIAGNCTLGDEIWIGGGAMVADGIRIENEAQVLIGSVVIKDVKLKEVVSGNFAFDHKKNKRKQIELKR